jgi:chromate transporter
MLDKLLGLVAVFAPLSLLSFGGGQAIIPEMQHKTVDVQHWLDGKAFADIFGLSRAAPGPSTLIVALIGWQVAGFLGALTATIAIFLPSSLLLYAVSSWWSRNPGSPMRTAVDNGLAPVATGLFFAGPVVILQSAHAGWLEMGTTAGVCLILFLTKAGPYAIAMGIVALYAMLYAIVGHPIL